MKIALLGYGKMGQEIEKMAIKRGHDISLILDNIENWEERGHLLRECEIGIDFSTSDSVVDIIYRCFEANIPVVTGTTGWHDDQDRVFQECQRQGKTLFYATNFSIGVNIFFELNRFLSSQMSRWHEYEISIEETHHVHKQDAPSGTAIVLANDIIRNIERKEKWVKEISENPEEIEIKSYRTENIPGTHIVRYESEIDSIEIIHTAKNRRGFALGALLAAEWVIGQKGVFFMKDMLQSQKISDV
ncbi:MAG: 4-hydroxy-tetrahydrodipicolinate reductase [bacterium]